jgi:hypothetical protein
MYPLTFPYSVVATAILSPTCRICSAGPSAVLGAEEHPVDIADAPMAIPAELVPIACINWRLLDFMV